MVLTAALRALAAGAQVPVFLATGLGGRQAGAALFLDRRLRILPSPRSASLLILSGRLTPGLTAPAIVVHDQMAQPRAVLQWLPDDRPDPLAQVFEGLITARRDRPLADQVVEVHRKLMAGGLPSSAPVLLDIPPAEWRGVGPYGQGGKGMTGGVPYGRRLASRAPDRDALELDFLDVRIGPYFPALPPGMVLEMRIQGDVVQSAAVLPNPMVAEAGEEVEQRDVFAASLQDPVRIAELERSRAARHLTWIASYLRLLGLDARADRAARIGAGLQEPHGAGNRLDPKAERFLRALLRSRSIAWLGRGVGKITPEDVPEMPPGPVTRAAGARGDQRLHDAAYRAVGFEPVIEYGSDAHARFRVRVREVMQSLEVASVAGDLKSSRQGLVESPRGLMSAALFPSGRLLATVPELIRGLEWGEAIITVASLDIDMQEAGHPVMEAV